MSNYGPPVDGGYYDDQPAGYGGDRQPPGLPPNEPVPWYRTPAAMFASGVLVTLLLALIVWSVIGSHDAVSTTTTQLTPISPTAVTTTPRTAAPQTKTVTITETSTVSAPPTTTAEPTTRSVEPSTTTSTVTSTTTSTTTNTTTVTVTPRPPGG